MIGSDLGRLAVFAALPFVGSATAIVALAARRRHRERVLPAGRARRAAEPRRRRELATANALLQLVEWTTTAVGPLVGGALVAASGPDLAYWVNAVTFALSALLVARIPRRLLQSDRPIGRGHWGDLAEGSRVVRRSRALLCVLIAWSIVMLANAAINVAEVFLAKQLVRRGRLRLRAALDRLRDRARRRRARRRVADRARPRRRVRPLPARLRARDRRRRGRAQRLVRRRSRWCSPASGTAARSSRTSRSSSAAPRTACAAASFTLLMSVNYAVLGARVRASPAR